MSNSREYSGTGGKHCLVNFCRAPRWHSCQSDVFPVYSSMKHGLSCMPTSPIPEVENFCFKAPLLASLDALCAYSIIALTARSLLEPSLYKQWAPGLAPLMPMPTAVTRYCIILSPWKGFKTCDQCLDGHSQPKSIASWMSVSPLMAREIFFFIKLQNRQDLVRLDRNQR